MYAYKQTEPRLWTVGFYAPDDKWIPESDHDSRDDAAERVHFLNGGERSGVMKALEQIADLPFVTEESDWTWKAISQKQTRIARVALEDGVCEE